MNLLMKEMKRSLKELELGLKGELTITADMEDLSNCLFLDQVPPYWTKLAYASLHGLSAWYSDLLLRYLYLGLCTLYFLLPFDLELRSWRPGLLTSTPPAQSGSLVSSIPNPS